MYENRYLERLSNPKMLVIFSLAYIVVMTLIANITLAFIQAVMKTIEQFRIDPKSTSFTLDWRNIFNFQESWGFFYLGFAILSIIGLFKFIYNIRMSYSDLNKGQHGTSEFEQVRELKKQYKIIPAIEKEYDGDGGVIISALQEKGRPYRLLIDDGPIHTMAIGITRSGKGETFVFPMIDVQSRAKNKPSLVINDPKGELAAASYDTLVARGYDVYVFNLIQQYMGMGFNPLQLVIDAWKSGNTSLAQQYANSISFMLYDDPSAKDKFWSNSAKSLVTAIILALTEDALVIGKDDTVNLYSVANFLATFGSDNDEDTEENALDQFFKARDEINPARMMYATSNFAAGNTRAGIFSTAMDKLQIFTLEPNAKLTSYNSLDLTDVGFGEKPIAVFMVTPDFDESNHVLASMFVSQIYRVNAEKATMSPSGKMKRQVHLLLDEVGNMPVIEGLPGMVTVGAGRGFRIHLILQAYSQLKSKYGDDADTIIGNCSNQIYILTKDKATAEQFSALIGTKTITDISRSGKLLSTDKSHSESVKERALLLPDELMQLKEGESVVVRANKRQDNKRKKIVPKPIFNKGVTAAKFRYEYLSQYFDNSKSILSLPIMSTTYHNLDMNKMVFTSKNDNNQYLKMSVVMGAEAFFKLLEKLRKEIQVDDEIENWTFIHLFSFLAYESDISRGLFEKSILPLVDKHLPKSVIEEWEEEIKQQCDERKTDVFANIESLNTEEDIQEKMKRLITEGAEN